MDNSKLLEEVQRLNRRLDRRAAKQKRDDLGWLVGLGLIGVAIWAVFLFFSNLFSLTTISDFGFEIYTKNVVHLHDDVIVTAKRSYGIYDDMIEMANVDKTKPKAILPNNHNFMIRGYARRDAVTWVAVRTYLGNQETLGYILAPKNIGYQVFSLSDEPGLWARIELAHFEKLYAKEFRAVLHQQHRIYSEADPVKIQTLVESQDFAGKYRKIDFLSSDKALYYCDKDKHDSVMKLYEEYHDEGLIRKVLNR